MITPERTLSKSRFLRGQQCPKSLYFSVFEPEGLAPADPEAQARMAAGLEVGRVAHGLFGGGVYAGSANPLDLLAAEPPAIFEATLAAGDGLSARIDILARGRRGWRLIEVKSSTSVKPEHLPDVAFQLHLARLLGIEIEAVEILHLNKDYVRRGDLDLEDLFSPHDVTAEAEALVPAVVIAASDLRDMLHAGRRPDTPIGPQCRQPYACDAIGICWSDVPRGSVLEIAHLSWKKRFALYHRGVVRIEDVPEEVDLPSRSRRHVEAHRGNRAIIDRPGLRTFLNTLVYPVYLLDFETVGPAIPRWDSSGPYARIPFQFSLHVLARPGAAPAHTTLLAEPGPDPRPAVLDALLAATEGEGTILAYHMPFEIGVMEELAEAFPERKEAIERRLPRMDDLIKPFRSWNYWLPEMRGSFSIKSVAPALAPELSYEGLEVRDGLTASLTYERLLAGVHPDEDARLRRALLEYCRLDTLAMVRVLEAIRQVAEGR